MKTLGRVLQDRVTPFTLFLGTAILCVAGPVLYVLSLPKGPTFQGRNMEQWLRVLRTDGKGTEHPLRIIRVVRSEQSEWDVEVPLSWDLVHKYSLADTEGASRAYGKFRVTVDGYGAHCECWRATNGNCLLRCSSGLLKPGTNELQVSFGISYAYRSLEATGPRTHVVYNDTEATGPTIGLSQ